MDDFLISICIPAYNAAGLIGETLESIKKQTYSNWELIVIEDGSDDGTREIVDSLREGVQQKVIYHKNVVNKGLPATRNVAVSKAKGYWLAFVDSDDVWHPDHLQSLIETAQENPDYDFIHSGYNYFMKDINQPTFQQNISTAILNNFPISFYNQDFKVQPSSIMLSQKLFAAVNGFDESYRYVEDLNFYFRICELGYKFAYSRKNTLNYRRNPNGLTSNPINMSLYAAKAYEEAASWKEIPNELKRNKISGLWLATARLARDSDLVLAKSAIKSAIKHRVTIFGLMIFVRIYLTPVKYNKP
jgi:teichuronic acid biosynthesis glycosyltransferase TuaG